MTGPRTVSAPRGTSLNTLGWQSTGTSMSELVAENGLSPIPQGNDSVSVADTIYYTSVK